MLKKNKREKLPKEKKEKKEKLSRDIKEKRTKKKHVMGPIEFLFNFVSLVFMLGVAIYFGGRSLYYYSKQNVKIKEEAMTINGLVVQNNDIAKEGTDGLHQDADGYYFKGNVTNNYVMFENRMYRIVRVNSDDTVKLISENFSASFMWGESSNYKNSNVQTWLTKTEDEHSGVFYNTINNAEKSLVKTTYEESILKDGKIISLEEFNNQNEEESKEETTEEDKEEKKSTKKKTEKEKEEKKEKDYVTILTVKDYTLANGKSSYLNNGKMFYLLGLNDESENLYVEEDGSIQSTDSLSGYGIRPVITLKKNTEVVGGSGTKEDPYVVKSKDKNYVNSYVKLGDDTWKVSSIDGENLRLYLNGYINENGGEVTHNYSSYNSIYEINDRTNVGNYLNYSYLGSLPYQGSLVDCNFYIGEISDDAGYGLGNIYSNVVGAKVGLLNIFDNTDSDLSDYFHINTTSQVGSMQYNRYSNGLLEEADVRDVKHIVPVVCINKNSIKSGEGTTDNPYKVE
jgi:hypothetical protein